MPEHSPVPRGLVLFRSGTPPGMRRRRLAFATILAVTAAALVWPVYAWVAGTSRLFLGLPLSLVWVIGWLAVMFVALIFLACTEPRGER